MPGKESKLNPLQLQKQMLITESEINRVLLAAEWRAFSGGASQIIGRAQSIKSFASSIIPLIAGAFRHKSSGEHEKAGWLQKMLKAVRLGFTVWTLVQQGKAAINNPPSGK